MTDSGGALSATDRLRMRLFVEMMERHGPRITRALQRRHSGDDEALIGAYQAALSVAVDQPVRAHRLTGSATVLECARGCRATKRITPDGIGEYACGRWFTASEVEFVGLGGLVDLLGIRGRLIEGRHPGRVRRLIYPDPKTGDDPYFTPNLVD